MNNNSNPPVFWTSFAIMMIVVVGGGIVFAMSTQQYVIAFVLQLFFATAWVSFFYRYRPRRAGRHNNA